MYFKTIRKYCITEKTTHTYFRLCESYRDEFGKPRQRMVLGLGRLEQIPDIDQQVQFIERLNGLINGKQDLFTTCIDSTVEQLAQHYYQLLLSKHKIDSPSKDNNSEYEKVKLSTLKNKEIREIGAESLCYQAFRQLKMDKFLQSKDWSDEQISLAATHIISRAVYPASEYKTGFWIKENSAICELSGYDVKKITKDKLYGMSHQLYSLKEELENHLSSCTNELFHLEDKIILYDLTNTYFEGRMQHSKKAKFGRSKEKRSDAKLIVLAVVVNPEGFLKYTDIFEGNTTDCSTLKTIIEKLDKKFHKPDKKPIVVMDAGIATEENIQYLKSRKYDYMCVSRSNIKAYQADTTSVPVTIFDKRKQPIELLKVRVDNDSDNYLWVKSEAKAKKENSMNELFTQRFEEGLRGIHRGIISKGGTKKIEKVWERIGRLKQKYPSFDRYYEIKVSSGKGIATGLEFSKKEDDTSKDAAGLYFLRTSLNSNQEQTLWAIYNIIREIEYTFRVLKTDLDLRPIFHKTDDASMAHLHLGLLAYWLVSTIRYQLKQKGYNHDWQEIIRTMNTQKYVTTTVENETGDTIIIQQCSEPEEKAKWIYQALNYKEIPLKKKKSVWHTGEDKKTKNADCQIFSDA